MAQVAKKWWIVGIDEVGRGPIAGPVSVGVFVWKSSSRIPVLKRIKIKDSKQMSPLSREKTFEEVQKWVKCGNALYEVVSVKAEVIDAKGIPYAIRNAIASGLAKLAVPPSARILLDGGLKAPKEYLFQKTIIKGDQKEKVISLASICAKVTRDEYMKKQSKKYPAYGFHAHKGYGTKAHYESISKHGLTPLHRKSFIS